MRFASFIPDEGLISLAKKKAPDDAGAFSCRYIRNINSRQP
jgi:hypothetical protein